MLSEVKEPAREPAREVLRLVGADREDERAGTVGGKSIVRWSEPSDSEKARLRRDCRGKIGPTSFTSLGVDPSRGMEMELTLGVWFERLLE